MNTQSRWTVLKILIPGLAAGLAYGVLVARPLERALTPLRETIDRNGPQMTRDYEEFRLKEQIKALKDEMVKRGAGKADNEASSGITEARARIGERLASILDRHHLRLMEESADPGKSSLPPGLLPPTNAGPEVAKTTPSRVRTLRFQGRYMDVLEALREIEGPGAGILPIRLVMARAGEGRGGLTWTLVVWV